VTRHRTRGPRGLACPRIYPYRSTAASADCRIAEGLFDDVVDECELVGWYGETESQS
jgi:hypothetical protein